jgi:hypothetical protein
MDTDDYSPPTITLHPLCQKRLVGNPMSIGGMEVACTGCKAVFNCWSGNVDDGLIETNDPDFVAQQKAEAEVKAKELVAKNQKLQNAKTVIQFRQKLGKENFRYEFRNNAWYVRFLGTLWKLSEEDIEAIREQKWNTKTTEVVKRSIESRGIPINTARSLLYWELQARNPKDLTKSSGSGII